MRWYNAGTQTTTITRPRISMTNPKVTLTQLYYLVAIDNYGNFKKAAEACHKSQPSLTNAIKDLTDILDAGTLVDTSVIPLDFTPAGKK